VLDDAHPDGRVVFVNNARRLLVDAGAQRYPNLNRSSKQSAIYAFPRHSRPLQADCSLIQCPIPDLFLVYQISRLTCARRRVMDEEGAGPYIAFAQTESGRHRSLSRCPNGTL